MSAQEALRGSRALWNRSHFDLRSDETLAQLLDRGELAAWRELYARCRTDASLRHRIRRVLARVPIAYPHLWLAALANLGEDVDLTMPLPEDDG